MDGKRTDATLHKQLGKQRYRKTEKGGSRSTGRAKLLQRWESEESDWQPLGSRTPWSLVARQMRRKEAGQRRGRKYMDYEWKDGDCMQWAAFNELRNSSTRCEAGGARMAIQKDGPVHIGIDNQTTVVMCTAITERQSKRQRPRKTSQDFGSLGQAAS